MRRVVIRRKGIPQLADLKTNANAIGMTVAEYVDYMNSRNMNRERRRNRSSSYDMGPEPWRKD